MKEDIGTSFTKLVSYFSFVHRGCRIERRDGGFVYRRQFYPTLEGLDKAIDKNIEQLHESLNRIK